MSQLQIFESGQFGQLPVIIVDGVEWFGATEAATALSFSNPRDAVKNHVDEDETAFHRIIDSMGRGQIKKFINESGLYSLIFGAAKQGNNLEIQAKAKAFKRWITEEIQRFRYNERRQKRLLELSREEGKKDEPIKTI